MLAYQNGARQIDGALCALGAGAGNAPTEVVAATFDRLGITTGVDVPRVLAAADDVVTPMLPRLPWMDRAAITQGYAGVYSSFLLHAERAAERYGVPAHEILQRVGELGYVGGQEDMIIDVALTLQQERETADRSDADELIEATGPERPGRGRSTARRGRRPGRPGAAHRRVARLDAGTAYAIQDETLRRRLARGEQLVGVKLGLTSRAKQQRMNVSAPLWRG